MTTKQQEREALMRIRKIVESLGEGSYVATAMAGVFEMAEQNIDMDAAFSLLEERDIAREEAAKAKKAAEEAMRSTDGNASELRILTADLARIKEHNECHANMAADYAAKLATAEATIETMSKTITELKAKLYDLIIGAA